SLSDAAAASLVTTGYYTSTATLRGVTKSVTLTATALSGGSGSAAITVDTGQTRVFDSFTGVDQTLLANHAPDIPTTGAAWTVAGSPNIRLLGQQAKPTGSDYWVEGYIDAGTNTGTISV